MAYSLKNFHKELLDESPKLVREYLQHQLTVRARSPLTVEEYARDLITFFRFLKKHYDMEPMDKPDSEVSVADISDEMVLHVSRRDVLEFMNYLVTDRQNSVNTRLRKTTTLRRFYKYLIDQRQLLHESPIQVMESPKHKKALPKYLTLEQSIDLLNSVDGPDKERDYCILTLFLNCGMRLSELVGINVTDVRHQASCIRIVGKGDKERIIYLNEACIDAIDRYLAVRPKDGLKDKEALFISHQHKRISPKTVQYIVKKYLGAIDLSGQGYSVHKLRHTAATLMYQHGDVDIRVLKDILGHENLGTTEIYTHLSSKQMENAAKANPLSKVKSRTPKPENQNQSEPQIESKSDDSDKDQNKK